MDQQKIGTFLKQLRQERQLTQENLAEIMCVTNRSVSQRETLRLVTHMISARFSWVSWRSWRSCFKKVPIFC